MAASALTILGNHQFPLIAPTSNISLSTYL